jgi:hypothetical protein
MLKGDVLVLDIPETEAWNEETEEFVKIKPARLALKHSLISISKWEAKWHIPFFETDKNYEQIISYIQCMTLNSDIDEDSIVYKQLTRQNIDEIKAYLEDPMTATTIKETGGGRNNQKITSELIYCWMIQFNIPHEFEKWHISRLITLIRVCSEENKPKKKMTRNEIMAQNKAINAARRARLHTKG